MSDRSEAPGNPASHRGALLASYTLAASSTVATLFIAFQAWMARTTYMEAAETRFLEKKMEICFDNFDAAAKLDSALRQADASIGTQPWPPQVTAATPEQLAVLKSLVIPRLDELEGSLTKAEALGGLDKFRGFIAQEARGLSKSLAELPPDTDTSVPLSPEAEDVFKALSDLLSAQYAVFTGCRMIAEGKA